MVYATTNDVQARLARTLSDNELSVCAALLNDVAVYIDKRAAGASEDAKMIVSCRMVIRALGDGNDGIPVGASQGSMSGLGYSQSWTMPTNAATGEWYLSKADKDLLGIGNAIGSYSPVEELVGGEVL